MNKLIKYFIFSFAFVLVGLLVGFKIKGNFSGTSVISIDKSLKKLEHALIFIEENYVKETKHEKLVDDAIKGILEGLDPHSFYIPASEMKQMQEQMEGGFDGIGIQFNIVDDTLYVETPLPGGPSEKLGIMAGDRIVKVNGENIAGIGITNADVYRYLKGPKGTKVTVAIFRRGHKGLLEFTITRDRIPINSVPYAYMIAPETGYIQATRFSSTTYDEFKTHLEQLKQQGMQNLILDLRGNPGGYMTMAYKMADEFLSSGKLIVSTKGRIPQSRQQYKATSALNAFEKGALIVLIDYGSASASEIVAGAVQDHDRGLIVGVRSFGKGLVQIQEEFEDGSAIRIVISEYFTPSGRCIQKPYNKSTQEYEQEILHRFETGEIFDESKMQHDFPDSLKFKTASGRIVYGGGGIYPDVFAANDTTGGSKYLTELRMNDMFRQFAFHYVDDRPELIEQYPTPEAFVKNFQLKQSLVQDFIDFAAEKEVPFKPKDYERSKEIIERSIKAYIGRRLHNDDAFYPTIHELDNVLQKAIELIPKAKELEATGHFTEVVKKE
ncbi:MAG: S41 family peptidase [Bacteroidetes bacterium]|nr:MAG: S41 family peptidase [Bacteroidota bacterium]